ncbi:MAG: metallophosphoesterase [Armatimonadota bacterium]|nr:MAG: metallophosphoesterase [Armatimonadota bacterium]
MVRRVTIVCPRLPEAFDGLTVAVVADIHAGGTRGTRAALARIVETVNGLHPDVIALLGDVVHRADRAAVYLRLLRGLKAKEGVWACLGNHEHGYIWFSKYIGPAVVPSADEWRRMFADVGVRLLVNEAQPIPRGGSRIWLVGVDDAYSGNDDLAAALEGMDPTEFRLAITHSPDLIDDPRAGELDAVLAGHTHGGQVSLPLLGPLWAPCRKFRQRAAGIVHGSRTAMYVSRGVGEGLPIRFGCPPEMPFITLRRTG